MKPKVQILNWYFIRKDRYEVLLRSRYYHSQMDMELLTSGVPYENLPDTYVIFICDYDPFFQNKYQYTLVQRCDEVPELDVSAGLHTIFLSTKGKNDKEVSEPLKKFLKYVGTRLEDSDTDFNDPYVEKLQKSVCRIKKDRKMGERYMVFQEMLRDEREKGKKEGILESIETILTVKDFTLSQDEMQKIKNEENQELLNEFLKKLVKMNHKEEVTDFIERNYGK